jgi:putative addiction module killer protein
MKIIRYVREDGSAPFSEWLASLRDLQAKTAIRRRIDRIGAGNPGNTKPLRNGISEIKIDMGPGYRVYYSHHGHTIVLLLCGGDKRTQDADIAKAVGYWEDWKNRNRRAP